MHGLPCSSLQYCFGSPADVSADPAAHTDSETCHDEFDPSELPQPISTQPVPKEPVAEPRDSSPVSCHVSHVSIPSKAPNGTKPSSDEPKLEDVHTLQSSPSLRELSDCEAPESSPDLDIKIPRPSIIRHPQEFPPQEDQAEEKDYGAIEDGPLSSDHCLDQGELREGLPRVRSIMAQPDYMDGDCDELIKPKKLINPVKNSRNHQDLHRELLMNQKRGLAPLNKPELQKVMEKRKRDQVLKAQKEELEAHKKRSDLEIELMKRQQKLEQLELEQQKNEEEQENTPEFVKMKSNLRRTKQEGDDEEQTT